MDQGEVDNLVPGPSRQDQSSADASNAPFVDGHAQQGGPKKGAPPTLGDLIIQAPNWSRTLVTDHLDQQARLALFQACLATKQLVLDTAEHVTIELHVSEPLNMATLLTVRNAMQTRGKLPTRLELSTTDATLLIFTLGWLSVGMSWLDELAVEVTPAVPGPAEQLSTTVLTTIGRCCPNLRALSICTPSEELPSPDLFPKLKELTVRLSDTPADERLVRAVAPYVTQLTHLHIQVRYSMRQTLVPLLLSPGNACTHLHTLRLPAKLDDTLLGLLVGCAPVLEELHVHDIELQSDTHTGTTVQWRLLQFDNDSELPWCLSSLARLPLAPELELVSRTSERLYVGCDISSAEIAALAGRFKAMRVTVPPSARYGQMLCVALTRNDGYFVQGADLDVDDEPAVLRIACELLQSISWQDGVNYHFDLQGWSMSTQLMQELHALPRWGSIDFWNVDWLPEPQPYAALLRMLPDSYNEISFLQHHGDPLTDAQLESICLGAPIDRTAEAPMCIKVSNCEDEVIEAIQHKMQLGPYPHVVFEMSG